MLKQQAISGVRWTTISTVIKAVISSIQLLILVRFLDPVDFGIMAIVTVIINFSSIFMDLGVNYAVIHKQEITHKQLSSLYWVNFISGFVLFGVLLLISPVIASFYQKKLLLNIMFLGSLIFLIMPFGQQFKILFQKKLKFKTIANIEIFSSIIGFLATIYMAVNNFGVYTLVFNKIIVCVISSALFLILGLKIHRPLIYLSLKDLNEFIKPGALQMSTMIINYLTCEIDTLIIGKFLGIETLGIYNIGKTLVMMPAQIINPILTKVSFPVMSTIQNELERLKNIYLKVLNYLSLINFPIYMFMMFLAEPMVRVLFGKEWLGAVVVVQILSPYALIRSTGNPVGSLLLSKGRFDLQFYWTCMVFMLVPAVIYIGSFWGMTGICYSLLFMQVSLVVPNYLFLVKKVIPVKSLEYINTFIYPFLISLPVGLLALLSSHFVSSDLLKLILGLGVGIIAYLFLNIIYNKSYIEDLRELIWQRN